MDQKVLAVHRHGGIELQVCRHCGGVWLTHDQLVSRCVRSDTLPAESRRRVEARPRRPAMRRVCSQCLVPLQPQIVEAVEIDLCPKCGGLWLDAGEFDAVHAWYMSRPVRPAASGTGRKAGKGDLVEAGGRVVEIAGEAVNSNALGEIIEFLCEAAGSLLEGL